MNQPTSIEKQPAIFIPVDTEDGHIEHRITRTVAVMPSGHTRIFYAWSTTEEWKGGIKISGIAKNLRQAIQNQLKTYAKKKSTTLNDEVLEILVNYWESLALVGK